MTIARTEKVEVRLTTHDKQILKAAAGAAEQTLSAFVRTSAIRQAAAILQDRLRIGLDATRWAAFQAALDAPPRPVPRLAALLQDPARFVTREKDSA